MPSQIRLSPSPTGRQAHTLHENSAVNTFTLTTDSHEPAPTKGAGARWGIQMAVVLGTDTARMQLTYGPAFSPESSRLANLELSSSACLRTRRNALLVRNDETATTLQSSRIPRTPRDWYDCKASMLQLRSEYSVHNQWSVPGTKEWMALRDMRHGGHWSDRIPAASNI